MHIFAETERLILRALVPADEAGMFELHSNPEVHRYLGNNPVTDIEKISGVIEFVRQQYIDNGIGRWAMVEKSSNEFVGWTGMKRIKEPINNRVDFYDIGYRLIPRFWGKGYATEAAIAALDYAFTHLPTDEIVGLANVDNTGSRNVLQKIGLSYQETFAMEGMMVDWLRITREEWEGLKRNAVEE
jgi:ribosomal-protein-alanine N-acetyltransferase